MELSNSDIGSIDSKALQQIEIPKPKSKSQGNVMVVCRARPLNEQELAKGDECCLEFKKGGKSIAINMPGENITHNFEFD